ncbi:hypothetical protein B0H16DRAFT_727721 [Mycena metata]|uniref:Uncharacterized protein n=1 Tax=Mycena metata TaxID=1033252 RepID=A0AAD7K9K2_9AGAR|nr:hypothetical protein B0H16DRAFT_727721 [Mycena metata]
MKSPLLASVLLAVAQLAAAQTQYNWRVYNNGGCDHNSSAAATFPPNPAPAGIADVDTCISVPQGIDWNRLEVGIGTLEMFTFCGDHCTGDVLETDDTGCNLPPPGCAIASFIGFPPE